MPLTVVPTLLSDFSVKTSMLEDEGALTDVLTDGVLEYLAGMFYVHPSWLRDPPHAWRLSLYPRGTKLPKSSAVLLQRRAGSAHRCMCISSATGNPRYGYAAYWVPASSNLGIIIERKHQPAKGVTFSTYERWYEGEWGYRKCQLFYKVLVLFCTDAQPSPRLSYSGDYLEPAAFAGLVAGTLLPVDALSSGVREHWHPDDYVCRGCAMGHDNPDLPQVEDLFARYHLGVYLESLQPDR